MTADKNSALFLPSSWKPRHRRGVNTFVMVAAVALVATLSLPAYAYTSGVSSMGDSAEAAWQEGESQDLVVAGVNAQDSLRDRYSASSSPSFAANASTSPLNSTTGTTVLPVVQQLAAELMVAVAAGKLRGSNPDHLMEIDYLAKGQAVPDCGVDYRVLQVIAVAVKSFKMVGVSDINRLCTKQNEGGSVSQHNAFGGGHAVDFYLLDGASVSGRDERSLKLISILDPLVPAGTQVGQSTCGSIPTPLVNFLEFPDSCSHLHIDFGRASGSSLKLGNF